MVEADVNGFLKCVLVGHRKTAVNILYNLNPNVDGPAYAELVGKVKELYSGAEIDYVSEEKGITLHFSLTEKNAGSAFLQRRFMVGGGVPDEKPVDVLLTANSLGLDLPGYMAEIIPDGSGWKLNIAGRKGGAVQENPDGMGFTADAEEPAGPRAITDVQLALLTIGKVYGFETEEPAPA
ncbi:MAG: hypothetical protein HY362_02570 [Candidatus Aenigmarchaeota archaeon]|nr:hypothetical protein [Candidatus Aenigmarchaeota archaeon]